MAIAQDAICGTSGTGSSSSASLNHAANVLVVIGIVRCSQSTNDISSVTVGGVSATFLCSETYWWTTEPRVKSWFYYIFRASAGNETVLVTFGGACRHAWGAVSYTGTKQEEAFFEGTSSNNAYGNSPSVGIAAGTAGRRILNFVGTNGVNSAVVTVTPTLGAEIGEWSTLTTTNATGELNYKDSSSAQTMTASLNYSCYYTDLVTGILPYVPITEYVTVSESGAGTDVLTLLETEYINLSDSGLGVETLTIGDIENIAVSDSGIGTDAIPGVEEFIVITETGLGTDTVLLVYKGETLIGGVTLPHVQRIHVAEPTIVSTKLVPCLLPTRTYMGKQGRIIEFEGWTDSLTKLEELKAFADGSAHDVWLPDGTNLSAHVTDVVPRHTIAPGRYPYTIHAVERMD